MAAAGPASAAPSAAASSRVTGMQLYTVCAAMAMDVAATLQAVAGIGYEEVEFAGYFEHSPSQIRGMLDRFGLAAPSTHMAARVMILA